MGICGLSEEEKKAIEFLKEKMTNWRKNMPEDKELHAEDIVLNLIQKQESEINKLNKVINYMVGEIDNLNYETIGKWCTQDKGNKCENCDNNNYECIKEYFLKEK